MTGMFCLGTICEVIFGEGGVSYVLCTLSWVRSHSPFRYNRFQNSTKNIKVMKFYICVNIPFIVNNGRQKKINAPLREARIFTENIVLNFRYF